jgi:hypothetical protein
MPTPSALPLRLQIINRVVTALQAITAGANYWFTPTQVVKHYVPIEEIQGAITYMVYAGTGEGQVTLEGVSGPSSFFWEDVFVTIHGTVRADKDTAEIVAKCIRDVRKAIDADAIDKTTAGALGQLTVTCTMFKAPTTDNGWFSKMSFAEFEIQLVAKTEGTYADL